MDRIEASDLLAKLAKENNLEKAAMRYLLSVAGSIPVVGGAIAGIGNVWAEDDQVELNEALAQWAATTNSDLDAVVAKLDSLLKEPSTASLTVLLSEIFGDEIAASLMDKRPSKIAVMLHPSSVTEFDPFMKIGLVQIQSTGSMTNMGANNRCGGHVEELKRPYGMGNGFILEILPDTVDS